MKRTWTGLATAALASVMLGGLAGPAAADETVASGVTGATGRAVSAAGVTTDPDPNAEYYNALQEYYRLYYETMCNITGMTGGWYCNYR